jgi:DNA-binding response OmpR family regulator
VTRAADADAGRSAAPDAAGVLLVEDDPNLGTVLQEVLSARGFVVTLSRTGEEGRAAFESGRFDLCLIDVMLPGLDGFELARRIRVTDAQVPIVFLTARSLPEDRIRGLTLGADDYVTKPFNLEELVLRLRAVLRRAGLAREPGGGSTTWRIGTFLFSYAERRLSREGRVSPLTHKEAELLRLLCLRPGAVLERSTALVEVWGTDSIFTARSMDVYISRLRKHLRDDPQVEIMNVHGVGFSLILHTEAEP